MILLANVSSEQGLTPSRALFALFVHCSFLVLLSVTPSLASACSGGIDHPGKLCVLAAAHRALL